MKRKDVIELASSRVVTLFEVPREEHETAITALAWATIGGNDISPEHLLTALAEEVLDVVQY